MSLQSVHCDVSNQSGRCNETENLNSHAVASAEQFSTPDDSLLKNGIILSPASDTRVLSCDQSVSSAAADCDQSISSIATKSRESVVDCDESVSSCDIRSKGSVVDCDRPASSFITTSPAGIYTCTSCTTTDQGSVVDCDQPASLFISTSPAGILDCTSCSTTDQGSVTDCDQPASSFITTSSAGILDCTSSSTTNQGSVVNCDLSASSFITTSAADILDCTSCTTTIPVMALDYEYMPSFASSIHDHDTNRLSCGDDEGVVDEVVSNSTCLLLSVTPVDSQTYDEVITSVDANVDMVCLFLMLYYLHKIHISHGIYSTVTKCQQVVQCSLIDVKI